MDFDPLFSPFVMQRILQIFWTDTQFHEMVSKLHSLYNSALFDCGGNWHYRVKLGPKDRDDFLDNRKRPLSVKFSKMRIWILSLDFAKEKYHVTKCCLRWLPLHLPHKIEREKKNPGYYGFWFR
jgi:hypothetical protein